jgi:hypothetical protein
MKHLITLSFLIAAATAATAQFTYHEWNFDDPAGTLLENAENTGDPGTAAFGEGLTHTTNGEGQYIIGDGDDSLSFRQAPIGPFAGTLTYEMEIESWNLDDNTTFRNIAIQFRDSVNGSNVIQFQINQEGSGNVRFRIEDNNGLARIVVPGYEELPSVSTTTYVISIQLDTVSGAWNLKINGGEAVASGTATVADMDVIRFIVGNNPFNTGDDFFSVERLSIFSTEPAPVPTTWFGYDILDGNWVEAVGWLGWVNIEEDPWIYSLPFEGYMYLPEGQDGESGAWLYVID